MSALYALFLIVVIGALDEDVDKTYNLDANFWNLVYTSFDAQAPQTIHISWNEEEIGKTARIDVSWLCPMKPTEILYECIDAVGWIIDDVPLSFGQIQASPQCAVEGTDADFLFVTCYLNGSVPPKRFTYNSSVDLIGTEWGFYSAISVQSEDFCDPYTDYRLLTFTNGNTTAMPSLQEVDFGGNYPRLRWSVLPLGLNGKIKRMIAHLGLNYNRIGSMSNEA
ncbi:unnamed protein product, partial [Mesorhabditis belari]|uniref:Uncharacterized protein n=1 Tax=Mesorhabditis belari TaxID=2138241 RepID=A0AAF3ELX4_9BILA